MNEHWVNKGKFHGLQVEVLGPRVSFYDVVEGDVVRAYVDHANPAKTTFEIGTGGPVAPRHNLIVGHGVCEREVRHYTTRDDCRRLRVGITIHHGPFSALPHEFETRPVPGFEEAFYMVTPGKGIVEGDGLMGAEPVDTAWPVRGGNLVAIPMGWHRVVALPGVDGTIPALAYVWAYLVKQEGWEKV